MKVIIGEKFIDKIVDKTKLFCQEMQMTEEQSKSFEELILAVVKYALNTSIECANVVSTTRRIKNTLE